MTNGLSGQSDLKCAQLRGIKLTSVLQIQYMVRTQCHLVVSIYPYIERRSSARILRRSHSHDSATICLSATLRLSGSMSLFIAPPSIQLLQLKYVIMTSGILHFLSIVMRVHHHVLLSLTHKPAIITLLHHINDVSLSQLQLILIARQVVIQSLITVGKTCTSQVKWYNTLL